MFYASEAYTDQLFEGDNYAQLNTTISICLLLGNLFAGSDQMHHRFQLMDAKSGRKLDRAIEVHTVELQKFSVDEITISNANPLTQWCWLILNAHNYSAEDLRRLFPTLPFQRAISCLETISSKTKDKAMHDQREKAQRDYDWMLSTARQQGIEEGAVIGAIQSLQQILGDAVSSTQVLTGVPIVELQVKHTELQERVRSRLS